MAQSKVGIVGIRSKSKSDGTGSTALGASGLVGSYGERTAESLRNGDEMG